MNTNNAPAPDVEKEARRRWQTANRYLSGRSDDLLPKAVFNFFNTTVRYLINEEVTVMHLARYADRKKQP
jgi:hypothetical protein